MSQDNDEILINNILQGSSSCFEELQKKYAKLCQHIMNRHFGAVSSNMMAENYGVILYDSVKSYNSTKGSKFSTWLTNHVKFFCLSEKRRYHKTEAWNPAALQTLVDTGEYQDSAAKFGKSSQDDFDALITREYKTLILEEVRKVLEEETDPMTRQIIENKFFPSDGISKSCSQFGRENGLSHTWISTLCNRFLDKVRKRIARNVLHHEL